MSLDYNIEDGEEIKFLKENRGDGQVFPEGPVVCMFKGKKMPMFVACSEGGGMDGFILTSILKHLGNIELYDKERRNGITPFILLDGYQSRFELEFLKYINNEQTKWNVCIRVPYGTALRQVGGDLSQQNGKFKILLSKKTRELFEKRLRTFCQHMYLLKTDIMVIIKDVWPEAFGDVESNLKAIYLIGWNLLTRILLLHPIILATITKLRIKFEQQRMSFPTKVLEELALAAYTEMNGTVTFGVKNNVDGNSNSLNFNSGPIATHVANSIMAEKDQEEAHEQNKLLKAEGRSIAERVSLITKKMTAGKLVLDAGSFYLDKNVLLQAKRRQLKIIEKENEAIKRDDLKYMIDCYKADMALARNDTMDIRKWKSVSDIIAYLQTLRGKNNPGVPTKRIDAECRFYQWNSGCRVQIVHQRHTYEAFETWLSNENSKKNGKTVKGGNKKSVPKNI